MPAIAILLLITPIFIDVFYGCTWRIDILLPIRWTWLNHTKCVAVLKAYIHFNKTSEISYLVSHNMSVKSPARAPRGKYHRSPMAYACLLHPDKNIKDFKHERKCGYPRIKKTNSLYSITFTTVFPADNFGQFPLVKIGIDGNLRKNHLWY